MVYSKVPIIKFYKIQIAIKNCHWSDNIPNYSWPII